MQQNQVNRFSSSSPEAFTKPFLYILLLLMALGIVRTDLNAQDQVGSGFLPVIDVDTNLYPGLAEEIMALWESGQYDQQVRLTQILALINARTGLPITDAEREMLLQSLQGKLGVMSVEDIAQKYLPLKQACHAESSLLKPGAYGLLTRNAYGVYSLLPITGVCVSPEKNDYAEYMTIADAHKLPLFYQIAARQSSILGEKSLIEASNIGDISYNRDTNAYPFAFAFDLEPSDVVFNTELHFNQPQEVEELIKEFLNVDPALCHFIPSDYAEDETYPGGVRRGLTLETPQGNIHFCMLRTLDLAPEVVDLEYTEFLEGLKHFYGIDLSAGMAEVPNPDDSPANYAFFVQETASLNPQKSLVAMFSSASTSFAVVESKSDSNTALIGLAIAIIASGFLGGFAWKKVRGKNKGKKRTVSERQESELYLRADAVSQIVTDLKPVLAGLDSEHIRFTYDYLVNAYQILENFYKRLTADTTLANAVIFLGIREHGLDINLLHSLVNYHPSNFSSIFAQKILEAFKTLSLNKQTKVLEDTPLMSLLGDPIKARLQAVLPRVRSTSTPAAEHLPVFNFSFEGGLYTGSYSLPELQGRIEHIFGRGTKKDLQPVIALVLNSGASSKQVDQVLQAYSVNRIGLLPDSAEICLYYVTAEGIRLITINHGKSVLEISPVISNAELERLKGNQES